jgi:hypothetical protein
LDIHLYDTLLSICDHSLRFLDRGLCKEFLENRGRLGLGLYRIDMFLGLGKDKEDNHLCDILGDIRGRRVYFWNRDCGILVVWYRKVEVD